MFFFRKFIEGRDSNSSFIQARHFIIHSLYSFRFSRSINGTESYPGPLDAHVRHALL
jgi:hypothetical protein